MNEAIPGMLAALKEGRTEDAIALAEATAGRGPRP
jgi:hypothetical protein